MRKICFGTNITTTNGKMTNLTNHNTVKSQLQKVYRMPSGLIDINGCFQNCTNFVSLEAEIPNSVKYMSSSFEGCEKFYKNISIPEECVDMTKGFKGSGIKGTITIPENVIDMQESFKGSKIEKINFLKRTNKDDMNNMKESFKDCKELLVVEGVLPSTINVANQAFSNTGIKDIDFLQENHYIDSAYGMFEGCKSLNSVSNNLNINQADSIFNSCSNLQFVNNIKGNVFANAWRGCSNLQSIGLISGNLVFDNSFVGVDNYSNVLYLQPNSLNFQINDQNFLNNTPLRIYGTGHGLEHELNFQNAHTLQGDYISGYCDPDDFENIIDNCFFNYQGDNNDLFIPKYFRSNLLDESTKYCPVFNNSFKNKSFNSVYINGGDIGYKTFENSHIDSLQIFYNVGNYNTVKINNYSFYNTSINDFYLKSRITSIGLNIGDYAFLNSKISYGKIEPCLNIIGNNAFQNVQGNLSFCDNINVINDSGFYEYKGNINGGGSLFNVNIIHDNAFRNMNGRFTDYRFKNIGNNVFYNAKVQNRINLSIATNIGQNAFYNSDVMALNIPDNITLASNSFYGMNSLTDLNIHDLNSQLFGGSFPTSLKNVVLRNTVQDASETQLLKFVEIINMPNGGDVVDKQFMGLKNLKYFYSKNNPNIGKNAFSKCSNLLTISNVNNIGIYAFNGCSNLLSLYSSGEIPRRALKGCWNLTSLTGTINVYGWNGTYHHIGQLWDYDFIELNKSNSNSTYRDVRDNELMFEYYYDAKYNHYLYVPKTPNLTDLNIHLGTRYAADITDSEGIFRNISSLKNITFSYFWYGKYLTNTVLGCSNLINYNIIGRHPWYLPDSKIIKGAYNIQNVNFNFNVDGAYSYTNSMDDTRFQNLIDHLSTIPTLNNVNFGTIRLINSNSVFFNNLYVYNYSKNITILPDVSNGNGYYTTHSWFYSNFTIPTKYVGLNVQTPTYGNYHTFPNHGSLNLNNKIFYFDNHVLIMPGFLDNRQNFSVYVEDVPSGYTTPFEVNNSSNITLYYTNIIPRPFNTTEISNDGKNYYYANNINVIYQPNYNYATYVSKIR